MKKIILSLVFAALVAASLTSCSSSRRGYPGGRGKGCPMSEGIVH